MNKVLFAMAVAGMFGFGACNNCNKDAEAAADTMAVEAVEAGETVENAVEEVVDSAVEAIVEEVAE